MKTFKRYKENLKEHNDSVYSYETEVATIDHEAKVIRELGYWSKTTRKHINYVANEYGYTLILFRELGYWGKAITIVYYSEVIDNRGRTESSSIGHNIFSALTSNPDERTDDMVFEGPNGEVYFIDDLIGKLVYVPEIGIFTVPED